MKTKRKFLTRTAVFLLALAFLLIISLLAFYIYVRLNIDFDGDVRLFSGSQGFSSTIFYASEVGSPSEYDESYIPIELEISGSLKKIHYPLNEISRYLKEGIVAVEDRRFFEHKGVDIKRTAAAAVNYITKKENRFGGSTITQQVVKNISGDKEIKLTRKLNEIIRAVHIEQNYTKEDILELYLNVIPMSDNMYGVGIASRSYFGVEPEELSASQAATLIGITNAPGAYNPYKYPEKCLEKRNKVLYIMRREGVISEDEYLTAVNEPLGVLPKEEAADIYDSWYVETVINEAAADLAKKLKLSPSVAEHLLLGGGYKIYTAMDLSAQAALEEYFENEDNFSSEILNGLNYAMVISDNENGNLAAIVGGVGKKRANRILNQATVAHIPGSVLKPIALYAPLIDEGKICWSTVFDDVPTSFNEANGEYSPYPKNSPNVYDGLTTVKDALRLSKNTVAIRLCELRGVKNVFWGLKDDFGFDGLVESEKTADGRTLTDMAVSPMALGQLSYGIPLTKLTEAYGVLSGDGVRKKMRSYLAVCDNSGEVVLRNGQKSERILKSSSAKITTKLLEEVVNSGTARSLTLSEKMSLAGKTGTSSGGRDKLFVGYTPYYTAGIWCGFDGQNKSVEAVAPTHLKIWDDVMIKIHEGKDCKAFSTEGLLYRPYCKDSGELFSENCLYDVRGSRLEYGYFTPETAPRTVCTTHVACYYDSVEKGIATSDCPTENLVKISLIRVERAFPTEIFVTDAEYVYRYADGNIPTPTSDRLPYFYYALPPGEYAGISGDKKQFNSVCEKHK